MANTLDDLYLKYVNRVGKTLENDRYFQYLYAMVEAGSNVLQQKHQILNKIVDERWISTIEDSLDAINNIIDKPRRFITTSEEVVPVSLAKKITADSVRHLSMNTQFIASTEEGDVQPTRVLNVTTEESYDLYENRFIYHLIYRLIAFVDKRTDVIFWSTGNETQDTLTMESSVDDAYEQIHYKIEMNIKNTQSLVENDNDNMQVFMRIDRVRRLVFALRSSAFFSIMSGCAKVHSPIQRTNLMMKDPNYRTCYKLWQFLESYDEVGYSIEVQDSSLGFDEEYMIQMYTNMITNYTVFKSILDTDGRDLVELQKKKRKPIKPKFIKKIEEEIVDNRDLPDVEIRKVFLEEVTQAQLDAEAKVEELTKRCEEAEQALEECEESEADAQRQIQGLYQQISTTMQQQMELEDELEAVIKERDEQLEQLEEQKNVLAAKEQKLNVQYEKQLQEEKTTLIAKQEELTKQYEQQQEEQKKLYETQIVSLQEEKNVSLAQKTENYENKIVRLEQEHREQLTQIKLSYESKFTAIKQNDEARILSLEKEVQQQEEKFSKQQEIKLAKIKKEQDKNIQEQIERLRKQEEDNLIKTKQSYEDKLLKQQEEEKAKLNKIKQEYEDKQEKLIQRYEENHKNTIDQLMEDYKKQIQQLEEEKEQALLVSKEAQLRMEEAKQAQKKAEDKAEGTRLSRYIISSLSGRGKKNTDSDKDENK